MFFHNDRNTFKFCRGTCVFLQGLRTRLVKGLKDWLCKFSLSHRDFSSEPPRTWDNPLPISGTQTIPIIPLLGVPVISHHFVVFSDISKGLKVLKFELFLGNSGTKIESTERLEKDLQQ